MAAILSPPVNWVSHFEANASRPDPVVTEPVNLTRAQRAALARTLQRFHLAQSREGVNIQCLAAKTGDRAFQRAIELSMAEKHTHSRWFGLLLARLDVRALGSHWSDALFTRTRRAGGLAFEVLTIRTAEVVGGEFLRLVANHCPDHVTRTVFRQVVEDERGHIRFHTETLDRTLAGRNVWRRWYIRRQAEVLMALAVALICVDQGPAFRAFKISRSDFASTCFCAERVTPTIGVGHQSKFLSSGRG